MGKIDQAKMLMKVHIRRKAKLKKMIIEASAGDGAVVVEITGEQKIKNSY